MNKRIEHLATQAGLKLDELPDEVYLPLEQFAQLVAQDCIDQCGGKGTCIGAGMVKKKITELYGIVKKE